VASFSEWRRRIQHKTLRGNWVGKECCWEALEGSLAVAGILEEAKAA